MDKSQILGLARQAGFSVNDGIVRCMGIDHTKEILALAELAMAAEREVCAALCEQASAQSALTQAQCGEYAMAMVAAGGKEQAKKLAHAMRARAKNPQE